MARSKLYGLCLCQMKEGGHKGDDEDGELTIKRKGSNENEVI